MMLQRLVQTAEQFNMLYVQKFARVLWCGGSFASATSRQGVFDDDVLAAWRALRAIAPSLLIVEIIPNLNLS